MSIFKEMIARIVAKLQELEMHENGDSCLTTENREILRNSDQLIAEYKKQPCHLERLIGRLNNYQSS